MTLPAHDRCADCGCTWSCAIHGDLCPLHGQEGDLIPCPTCRGYGYLTYHTFDYEHHDIISTRTPCPDCTTPP